MGRGCTREAKERYPGVEYRLGDLLKEHGNRVMRLGRFDGAVLASFPVKHHWKEEADSDLIRRSAAQLAALADKFDYEAVVMPRAGCGNGKLSRRDVRPILAGVLDDRFTVVTFPRRPARSEKKLYLIAHYAYDSLDDLRRGRYRRTVHEAGYRDPVAANDEARRLTEEVQAAGALASFPVEEYLASEGV